MGYSRLSDIGKSKYFNLPNSPIVNSSDNDGTYSLLSNIGKPKFSILPNSPNETGAADSTKYNQDQDKGFDTLGLFGAGAQGLSAIGSLMQAYNGAKQVQLGRDTFNFQRNAFNQDSANQAKTINMELEDRQRARIGSTGNNNANNVYESLDSYLNKNRVTVKPF